MAKLKPGPKSDKPLNIKLGIRLDFETANLLDIYCEKNKIDRSEAIRRLIRETKK